MAFTRTIENFVCEHCDASVQGSGFTNHCPVCLWSKHVDVQPGDRAEVCAGLMKPVAVEGSSPDYAIVHACTRCGAQRRNKTIPEDSTAALLAIVQRAANAS